MRYGVVRRTVHRWLVRYASQGLSALADKSSRPDRCPHLMPPAVEARIVELSTKHPGFDHEPSSPSSASSSTTRRHNGPSIAASFVIA